MPRLWITLCCLMLIACDKKSPPAPPVVDPAPANVTINGTERVGWDQPAADMVELALIGYAVYVDGTRAELSGAACASTATAAGFSCTARMPSMSAGAHTLELASFVNDGALLESPRSAALHVTLVAQASAGQSPALRKDLSLRTAFVVDGLESPTDLAFAPDGRIFVAERAGRIRIVRPPSPSASARQASLIAEPAISVVSTAGAGGQLLAIALDPQFERTGHVFAVYAAPARSAELMFTLARFRAVSDTLGDRAVLLDGVPAAASPSAALRFGPDGMLYAAFDDGGDPRRRRDAASLNGKVLRLNADGTTPADARGGTPVVADGYGSPAALDWGPPTGTLWVADRTAAASAFAFYRGALFPSWAGRLVSADTLFERGAVERVAAIAPGPDGAIYFLSDRAVVRLAPDRAP